MVDSVYQIKSIWVQERNPRSEVWLVCCVVNWFLKFSLQFSSVIWSSTGSALLVLTVRLLARFAVRSFRPHLLGRGTLPRSANPTDEEWVCGPLGDVTSHLRGKVSSCSGCLRKTRNCVCGKVCPLQACPRGSESTIWGGLQPRRVDGPVLNPNLQDLHESEELYKDNMASETSYKNPKEKWYKDTILALKKSPVSTPV